MNPFSVLYHHTLNESFTLPIGKINLKKKKAIQSVSVIVKVVVSIYLKMERYASFLVWVWGNIAFFFKGFSFIRVDARWDKDCCWVWNVDIRSVVIGNCGS